MRLLVLNMAMDLDDPVLEFAGSWIRALAKQSEFVYVLTMRAGRYEVPGNVKVYSVGKEKGYSEVRRALEFYKLLGRIFREGRIDACFSHMIPIFSILAAPILRAKGIPLVTWYAHPSLRPTLRFAHHLSDRMVTSLATTYPYKTDKLVVVGQGIDSDLFCFQQGPSVGERPVILCVGRISPIKGQSTLIEATALLHKRFHGQFVVRILGSPGAPRDVDYVHLLQQQIKDLSLESVVELHPSVPMRSLPVHYRQATVHVNLTPTGSGDKVVLEAMSCGRICVLTNAGFRDTIGQFADQFMFEHNNPTHLADRLEAVLMLGQEERVRIGIRLRDQVLERHSLEGLTHKLIDVFQSC